MAVEIEPPRVEDKAVIYFYDEGRNGIKSVLKLNGDRMYLGNYICIDNFYALNEIINRTYESLSFNRTTNGSRKRFTFAGDIEVDRCSRWAISEKAENKIITELNRRLLREELARRKKWERE